MYTFHVYDTSEGKILCSNSIDKTNEYREAVRKGYPKLGYKAKRCTACPFNGTQTHLEVI